MSCRNHTGLIAWQKALNLAHEVHEITKGFPKSETFGLAAQMRRSAISIPSSIAEGAARAGTREFLQFLHVARGSFAELETQLILACRARYITEDHRILRQLEDVGKLVNALIMGVRRRLNAQAR
jgi:four helix bundle protein